MNRLLAAALLVLLPSCVIVIGDKGHSRRGSGHRIQQSRNPGIFHALEFRGAGELLIQVGEANSLSLSGDDDLLGSVSTEVKDGLLVIDYPDNMRWDEDLHVQISMPVLHGVSLKGSGGAQIRNVSGDHLRLSISGSGNICAQGSIDQLKARISGSGELELRALAAKRAEVVISGSGDAELNVSEDLNYTISGSGDIDYIGAARAVGSISGSGSVDRN